MREPRMGDEENKGQKKRQRGKYRNRSGCGRGGTRDGIS